MKTTQYHYHVVDQETGLIIPRQERYKYETVKVVERRTIDPHRDHHIHIEITRLVKKRNNTQLKLAL